MRFTFKYFFNKFDQVTRNLEGKNFKHLIFCAVTKATIKINQLSSITAYSPMVQ